MPRATRSMEFQEKGIASTKPEMKSKRKGKSTNSNGHDCHICHKSNMTLSGLKIHLLTHSGEKPYLCTVCDKRFTCSSNLKKHQRIHNKDYIYECEVCGKTCSDPSNMKKHMTVHSGEKAYVCPSCGKSYSYAQSLRQHMDDVHVGNGEKRLKNKRKGHFPCPECGKVFGYYWRCSLHQARVHAVDRPYKCPECGKCFARETILNKHLQTHEKPYACTDCDRRFSFRDQLHKHNRTHSGERPYQCQTCLKSFSQRGSLTEHMRTHTGLKPFACQICGMKFASSSSLRRHERKVKSCFPAPQGEEIPMGSMFPRKCIYVPTPPINIPRVETRPVIDTYGEQNSYNPYIEENPLESNQITTANRFFKKNGPTSSTGKQNIKVYNNETGNNVDVNGNLEETLQTIVPNSQISMVVRCDKDGKISVVPVAVQLVNGTSSNNEPSNYHPCASNPTLDIGQQTFSEPHDQHVSMATSNNDHPSYAVTMNDEHDSVSTIPNPTLVTNQPTTVYHHSVTMQQQSPPSPPPSTNPYTTSRSIAQLPTMVFTNPIPATSPSRVSTMNLPLPTHQNTTSDATSHSLTTTITSPNPAPAGMPASPKFTHHLSTDKQQPPQTTNIIANGKFMNSPTRNLEFGPQTDVNNNSNSNLQEDYSLSTTHIHGNKSGYISVSNGPDVLNHHEASHFIVTTNPTYQPSVMYGKVIKYDMLGKSSLFTTNSNHEQPQRHILLPSTMTKVQSTEMKPSQPEVCVKTEPEDIKPVIGVDVPAFE